MLVPKARGELSETLFGALRQCPPSWAGVLGADRGDHQDCQIALWALYELHYRGFEDVGDDLEWHPDASRLRYELEADFESLLRARLPSTPDLGEPFAEQFFALVADHDGQSTAAQVQREASRDQVLELLRHRSIYHLKESDPVAWVVPRLTPGPKAALMELQYDEYGCGDPNRLHAHLFARGMEACGLRTAYGAYIDDVPVEVLEQNNAMSLFGLNRRLRGAALGHLAAFEMTSSQPSRRIAGGLERLEMPAEMVAYYTEHVEADALHEQLAVRTICGTLVAEEPALRDDVVFGAATCLDLEDRFAEWMLRAWADE